jgi:hypothetical protein
MSDIEKRVDELERLMQSVLTAVMALERIVYNMPRQSQDDERTTEH